METPLFPWMGKPQLIGMGKPRFPWVGTPLFPTLGIEALPSRYAPRSRPGFRCRLLLPRQRSGVWEIVGAWIFYERITRTCLRGDAQPVLSLGELRDLDDDLTRSVTYDK